MSPRGRRPVGPHGARRTCGGRRGVDWPVRARLGLMPPRPATMSEMRLRTRLNLVVAGLSAAFVIVLIASEVQSERASVREEIEAANRVASQLLGRLAAVYSQVGGPDLVLQFLKQLGRVRANEVSLRSSTGEVLYSSPAATYKAGREPPIWFGPSHGPRACALYLPASRRRVPGRRGTTLAGGTRRLG